MRHLSLLFAVAMLASSATALGAKNPARSTDAELAGRVRGALHATFGTAADEIGVTAQRGFVALYGEVPSDSVRVHAERTAAGVAGVRAVNNELTRAAAN